MSQHFSTCDGGAIVSDLVSVIVANREYLSEIDGAIGDGDHGINMNRGMKAVGEKLPTVTDKPIDGILKSVGMTLVSTVGGASGPLYGTAFMRSGMAVKGKEELDADDISKIFDAAIEGIVSRGKATTGEKTMVDAWTPAIAAAKAAADAGHSPAQALRAAADAAAEGAEATIPLKATKGRASYLGERSIGHKDPGATSTAYLLACAADAAEAVEG